MHTEATRTDADELATPNGSSGLNLLFPTCENEQGGEKPKEKVTGKRLLRLLEKQKHRCALTGAELTPKTVSLDHIVSLSEGGTDCMANVQLVHQAINTMKGTMGQAEFVHWCKAVAAYGESGS